MIERYSRPEMSAIWSEENKYSKWLAIELAVCDAWYKKGLIPKEDIEKLRDSYYDQNIFNETLKITKHEMTAFLKSITVNLGDEGRLLHQGLTTSDVWDTATSLQLKEAGELLYKELTSLESVLKNQAIEHKNTLMMGRTHGVHAEPITFGLKLASFYNEFKRNLKRLDLAIDEISICSISGPVGTYNTIDPRVEKYVANKLKLKSEDVSTQIIPRDRHAFFFSVLGIIGSSIERFAVEIRHLQRTEIMEVEEKFNPKQKGSSAMPHKRNPVLSENLTGLARVIRANLIPVLENISLWHERDISHSSVERLVFPDTLTLLDFSLNRMSDVIENLVVNEKQMLENLNKTKGLYNSQRVMLKLIGKGLTRERSYKIVQKTAMKSWNENKDFKLILQKDTDVKKLLSSKEIDKIFDLNYHLKNINSIFKKNKT